MAEMTVAGLLRAGILGVGASAALFGAPAEAAVKVVIQEIGADVVATTSGTFDPAGLFVGATNNFAGGVNGDLAAFNTTDAFDAFGRSYYGLAGPAAFGSGSGFFRFASAFSGTFFGFVGAYGEVRLTEGYVAGSPIVATTTFTGATLASLNLMQGVYTYSAPNDSITVVIGDGAAGVPEPSSWALLLIGFGVIGGAIRRRKADAGFRTGLTRYA